MRAQATAFPAYQPSEEAAAAWEAMRSSQRQLDEAASCQDDPAGLSPALRHWHSRRVWQAKMYLVTSGEMDRREAWERARAAWWRQKAEETPEQREAQAVQEKAAKEAAARALGATMKGTPEAQLRQARARLGWAQPALACQPANISPESVSDWDAWRHGQFLGISEPAFKELLERGESGQLPIEVQRKPTPKRSAGYYARKAVEVEENVTNAVENWGLDHTLEFTLTLAPGVTKEASPKTFSKAWNNFLQKWLRLQPWFAGEWVRVNECHKSGIVHAHCIVRTSSTHSVRRPGQRLKWNKRGKGWIVDGRTVAAWLPQVWRQLRGECQHVGVLMRRGLGRSHALQPIRTGGREMGRYVAKYVRKALTERPAHMKGVRLVNYSQTFERICRATITENRVNPLAKQICYWSEKKQKYLKRWKQLIGFDLTSNAAQLRRAAMAKVCPKLGINDIGQASEKLGRHWAYYLQPLLALVPCSEYIAPQCYEDTDGNTVRPWKSVAYCRALSEYGNAVAVYRFRGNCVQQADFDRIPPEIRSKEGWDFEGWRSKLDGAPLEEGQVFDESAQLEAEYFARAWQVMEKVAIRGK